MSGQEMQAIWDALAQHRAGQAGLRIEALFEGAEGAARMRDFGLGACGLHFDMSRTAIDAQARALLLQLFAASGAEARREAMFTGAPVNETEGRAVLHVALRAEGGPIRVGGRDVMPEVAATLRRMRGFATAVRKGDYWVSGQRVRDVVNIGIGGSDLGPAMAARALSPWIDGPRLHFVANCDGADLRDVLAGIDPAGVLFIVTSKTFATAETMANARAAYAWLQDRVAEPARHFAAVSCAQDRAQEFGILAERVFGFADWVGGRFSVWGPVGLALMIGIGPEAFDDFRAGAAAMDTHFRTAPAADNLPVWLALTGIWHHQVCGYPTRAVVPYAQRLALLPAHLQQLEMESNGKSVTLSGAPLTHPSVPVIWGAVGSNAQHAFFQMLHQGTQTVPVEFLLFAQGVEAGETLRQQHLLAGALAQAQVLMRGSDGRGGGPRLLAHRALPGNRPSVTLAARMLDPWTLGAILALYEHRTMVEGAILGINSFDQWGVEMGKTLAQGILPLLTGEDTAAPEPGQAGDAATRAMAAWLRTQSRD